MIGLKQKMWLTLNNTETLTDQLKGPKLFTYCNWYCVQNWSSISSLFYSIFMHHMSHLCSQQRNLNVLACTLNVLWQIKWFSSHLILLFSSPQRALSPRVPTSVCPCLEASNNCSSLLPSLFVSYRGSTPFTYLSHSALWVWGQTV